MTTEQDIEFFKKAKRIQELWEPKFGDWVINGDGRLGIVRSVGAYKSLLISREGHLGGKRYDKELCIFLPRQGQLQAMLEERGYALAHLGDERVPPDFEGRIWNPKEPYIALAEREPGDYVKGIGPTPSIALGRALIEVLKDV